MDIDKMLGSILGTKTTPKRVFKTTPKRVVKKTKGASLLKQKQWQNMGTVKRSLLRTKLKDSDKDGVPNKFDCRPGNKFRQDGYNKKRVALGTNIRGGKLTNTIANSASLRNDAINRMRQNPRNAAHYEMEMAHMNYNDGNLSKNDLNLVAKEYSKIKKQYPYVAKVECDFCKKYFP